jgi:hypothetical protein
MSNSPIKCLVFHSLQAVQAFQLFLDVSVGWIQQIVTIQPLDSHTIELSRYDVTNVPACA